jgi:hypothetical protein
MTGDSGAREAGSGSVSSIVSVFSGRIADTSRDPITHMIRCHDTLSDLPGKKIAEVKHTFGGAIVLLPVWPVRSMGRS